MIEIDGAAGEGGGQILRSALALSMITGKPFHISAIRANRSKPGLMRQHLVAVQAAVRVSDAQVSGAELGSTELHFAPGPVAGGDYDFAIGSAGSCTLVLQTIMPALLFAPQPSTIRITGGTHNMMAPPVQFLHQTFLPLLARMGAQVHVALHRHGFYPAGGGEVVAKVYPCKALKQLDLLVRGAYTGGRADALLAGIASHVGMRELACVRDALQWNDAQLHLQRLPAEQGPGNALLITLAYEHVTEVCAGFGARAVKAEAVAQEALMQAQAYLASDGVAGEHLADQLLLPLALAGGGRFTATAVSSHTATNAQLISKFLPVTIQFEHGERSHLCVVKSTCQPS